MQVGYGYSLAFGTRHWEGLGRVLGMFVRLDRLGGAANKGARSDDDSNDTDELLHLVVLMSRQSGGIRYKQITYP